MRKNLARVVSIMALGGLFVLGCKASLKVGGDEPPPPPPPPPPAATPAPAPTPKPKPRITATAFKVASDGKLGLPGPVVFVTGSDQLSPESDAVLEHVQKYLEATPAVTLLRIEGHTDNVGKPADNQILSQKRAMSVARWLVAKNIDCKRLIPVGFGDTKPIADNATEDGKAQNRRTSFFNAALNGKAIGNLPVDAGGKVAGDSCAK
jgi:OOP family OmpA-OmpF porin